MVVKFIHANVGFINICRFPCCYKVRICILMIKTFQGIKQQPMLSCFYLQVGGKKCYHIGNKSDVITYILRVRVDQIDIKSTT